VLVVRVRHETCATAKATYVTSAEASAHMAAATTAASGLCTRYKEAPGEHCACQQHYHSSCHDFSPFKSADSPPQSCQTSACLSRVNTNAAIDFRWECLCLVSTQFLLSQSELRNSKVREPNVRAHQIESSIKTTGIFRAISGGQTRTDGYRLLEAPLRLEPQSRHYAGKVVAQTR
jgi:hypothetical protein